MSLNSLSPTTDPATGGPDSAHFEDSLRQALLKDSPADARIADSGTGAPAFESGGSFAWSGELANASALTFTDAEGKVTVFSQALTPELFARVKADASAWSIINAQTADGTRAYLGSGQLIDQAQIQIMGWPEELGNGLIQFQTSDGKNYIVSERSNAEMYERVLTVNTPLPAFESGGSYAWDGELDTATRIVFTDAQGAQTTFSQDVSPTLFAQLKADAGDQPADRRWRSRVPGWRALHRRDRHQSGRLGGRAGQWPHPVPHPRWKGIHRVRAQQSADV
jgi:hypothetical protein